MPTIHRVHESYFEGPRLTMKGKVVVLFQGPWCPYCQAFRKHMSQSNPPKDVKLAEYVMDDFYEKTPLMFDVEVIPTVIAFEDGVIAWRHSGIPNRGLGEPTLHRIEKWAAGAPHDGPDPSASPKT